MVVVKNLIIYSENVEQVSENFWSFLKKLFLNLNILIVLTYIIDLISFRQSLSPYWSIQASCCYEYWYFKEWFGIFVCLDCCYYSYNRSILHSEDTEYLFSVFLHKNILFMQTLLCLFSYSPFFKFICKLYFGQKARHGL